MNREEAHKLIDRMPPDATWEDLLREIRVRDIIEKGLADSEAGRFHPLDKVSGKYGLPG